MAKEAEDGVPQDEEKVEEPETPKKLKTVAHAEEIDIVQAKKKVKVKKTALKPVKKKKGEKKVYTGRDIGIDVERPTKICSDENCPYHGHLSVRGQIIKGVCVTNKMNKTVVVQRERRRYNQKFERYEKRSKKIAAHNPECIDAQPGEMITVMECKPISKTVSFVVVGRD